MSLLSKRYNEVLKKDKEDLDTSSVIEATFPTGFDVIDYSDASTYFDDETGKIGWDLGMTEGTYALFIGKSGTGKSTSALQMAINIVDPYENGMIRHYDAERALKRQRVKNLSGWSDKTMDEKFVHKKKKGLSQEAIYKDVKRFARTKMELAKDYPDEFLVEHPTKKNPDGTPLKFMPPSVLIIDSLALLVTDSVDAEEEMSGQMSATAQAKANTQMLKRLISKCAEANMFLFIINHVNDKVDIGIVKKQAQTNYLKQDETVPGGNSQIYLANVLFKFVAGSKISEDKTFKLRGFESRVEFIKSRNAPAGRTVTLVFDTANGFSNDLSNLLYLKNEKLISGGGHGYTVNDEETNTKFKLADFETVIEEDGEFRKSFNKVIRKQLKTTITIPKAIKKMRANWLVENGDSVKKKSTTTKKTTKKKKK